MERHCNECGAPLRAPGEYHPFAFCVLKKAGLDPWREVSIMVMQLGLDRTDWPAQPPLIAHLVGDPSPEAGE